MKVLWDDFLQTSSLSTAKEEFYRKTAETRFCDKSQMRLPAFADRRLSASTIHRKHDCAIRRVSVVDELRKA
jgi:hypothetical protein